MTEQVEIVGYRRAGTDFLCNDTTCPIDYDALMTVTQHGRILADVQRREAELVELLLEAREKIAYMLDWGEWYNPEALVERIDVKLDELTGE